MRLQELVSAATTAQQEAEARLEMADDERAKLQRALKEAARVQRDLECGVSQAVDIAWR